MGSSALTNIIAPPFARCSGCWYANVLPTDPPVCEICCGTRRCAIPWSEVMQGKRRGTVLASSAIWRKRGNA